MLAVSRDKGRQKVQQRKTWRKGVGERIAEVRRMKDKLGIKGVQQSNRVTGGKRVLWSKEHKDERKKYGKERDRRGKIRRGNVRKSMIGSRDTRERVEFRAEGIKKKRKQEEGKRQDKFSTLCLRDNNR